LQPPETWQELALAASRLSSRPGVTPRHYGITLPANPGGSPIPLFFAWQNGAELLDADATVATVRTRAFEEAVDFYADFFEKGSSPREAGGLTNFYQAFADGLFAMFISGPWEVQGLRQKLPQLAGKWAVAPLPPRYKGGPRSSLAGGSSLVVFKNARHSDQAWQLIEYLSQPAVQAAFYEATTDLPARRSAWRSASLAGDPAVNAFYTQLLAARPAPQVPEWEQLQDKLGGWIERVVYGKASSRDALAGLATDLDAILEKRRWLKTRGSRP
jgi:multiple sugar transport system substrate-binding protein